VDWFVFRRGRTTYSLVHVMDAYALPERDAMQRVPGTQAAWLIEDFVHASESAATRLSDFLLGKSNALGIGGDQAARRARVVQLESDLRRGEASPWRLYMRERGDVGSLLKLSDELTPASQPDSSFGWIEFTLTDQNDQPIARMPWTLKQGGERVRGGTLDAQGNAYVDGIDPGTYTIAIGGSEGAAPLPPADWLSFELLDDYGLPVGGEPFVVTDAAGTKHEGALDAGGRGTLYGVAPGTCEITFTRLDEKAWGPAETFAPAPPPTQARAPEPAPVPAPAPREVDDGAGAEKAPATAIGAAHFKYDSAFPGPETFAALDAMFAAAEAAPAARLCVFGHADRQGSDAYNKQLADRRARAVLALLTQDLAAFDALAKDDAWRLIHDQTMLAGLGVTPITPDNEAGPQTQAATKAFQAQYNAGAYHPAGGRARAYPALAVDGVLGELTSSALRDAYLAKSKKQIPAQRFDGPRFAGCGEFNPVSHDEAANRRVSLAVFQGLTPGNKDFPCTAGDASKCPLDLSAQKAFDPKRRVPPRPRCVFYRKYVDESGAA
jgi:outer membrane protein OmpA-like peptidoglycan-associated protein